MWKLDKIAYRSESPEPIVIKKLHAHSGRDSWEERRFVTYDFDGKAAQLALAARALPATKAAYIELAAMVDEDAPELKSFKPRGSYEDSVDDQDFSTLTCSRLE